MFMGYPCTPQFKACGSKLREDMSPYTDGTHPSSLGHQRNDIVSRAIGPWTFCPSIQKAVP